AEQLVAAAAQAWVHGAAVDWARILPPATGTRPDLPTYAFQHQHFWLHHQPATTTSPADNPADTAFWTAVDNHDLDTLTDTLGLHDNQPLRDLLPALAHW